MVGLARRDLKEPAILASKEAPIPPPHPAGWLGISEGREALLRSLITSQAIEGIEVSEEKAAAILDRVLGEPVPNLY